MANCSKFMALSEVDKVIFAAELLHVAQSDDVLFERAKNLIQSGYKRGAFNGVKILPNWEEPHQLINQSKN